MKRIRYILLVLMLHASVYLHAQDVPASVFYCGIEVKLSSDAQVRVQEYHRQIIASPRYFNEMIRRAQIYMPFIEEAFSDAGVPLDLKYLAIQESALRAEVVSSSKAVGFWQFKEPAATELGLAIDNEIDERMHIFRSSQAAANYLKNANRGYDNWLYAMLSYYEGPTGAVPYTNPDYYGEKVMHVSASDHWYVLKAIANKLAYEESLSSNERPEIYLMPFVAKSGTQVKALLEKHGLDEEEFFRYNKWARNKKRIAKRKDHTYYVARTGASYIGHIPDPLKLKQGIPASATEALVNSPPVGNLQTLADQAPSEMEVVLASETATKKSAGMSDTGSTASISQPTPSNPQIFAPQAIDPNSQMTQPFVEFELIHDLHYGIEYVEYNGVTNVAEYADRYKKSLSEFLLYNGLIPGTEPPKGKIIYVERPEKRSYHIVEEGETLADIAADHKTSVMRIQNRNRMTSDNFTLFIGQKLYLRDTKPKSEQIIILSNQITEGMDPEPVLTQTESVAPKSEELDAVVASEKSIDDAPAEKKEEFVEKVSMVEKPIEKTETSAPKENPQDALDYLHPSADEDFKPIWVEHIVNNGETLFKISQKYGTQIDLIKKINRLESDDISQGQSLRGIGY